jgi:hypothetical protein
LTILLFQGTRSKNYSWLRHQQPPSKSYYNASVLLVSKYVEWLTAHREALVSLLSVMGKVDFEIGGEVFRG